MLVPDGFLSLLSICHWLASGEKQFIVGHDGKQVRGRLMGISAEGGKNCWILSVLPERGQVVSVYVKAK